MKLTTPTDMSETKWEKAVSEIEKTFVHLDKNKPEYEIIFNADISVEDIATIEKMYMRSLWKKVIIKSITGDNYYKIILVR